MIFEQIRVGGDRNFAYIVGDGKSKKAAVADPAYSPEKVLARTAELGLEVVYLFNTHGHFDHTSGNDRVLAETDAKLVAWGRGGLEDGALFSLGDVELKIIHTPGHTQDSTCILASEPGRSGKLITGDTLFAGSIGRTDFPGASFEEIMQSIKTKLTSLPDHFKVYPGHGPTTSISEEKRHNPFLRM